MDEDHSVATEGNVEMSDQSEALENKGEEMTTPKPVRHRKKRLINQLREQMEFYFSSANITKDRFMGGLMWRSPYISLETFCNKFNKIRSMTDDTNLLRKAVKKSSLLELSDDELMVRRKEEVNMKSNETECTIYVENIPTHVDHDWVRQMFSQYGAIDYISLPRYKHSCRPKGFAFVEFQSPEMADLALESFGAEKCRIPLDTDPSELQSIKTFEGNNDESNMDDKMTTGVEDAGMCIKTEEESKDTNVGMDENISKKRKRDQSEDAEVDENVPKKLDIGEGELSSTSKDVGETSLDEEQATTDKKSKKKKRKRSKKVKGDEVESIYLKVMSKKEWKALRNKYLNIQRMNMKRLKKEVQESRYQRYSMYRSYNYENPNMAMGVESSDTFSVKNEKSDNDKITKPQFIPNAVIKISFEEPPQDPKKLRETIREGGGEGVAYVDVSAMERDVYVRFLSEDAASSYKKSGCWTRMEILSGTEEEEYWKCIDSCWNKRREKKRNKQNGCGNNGVSYQERGREKLLQKAFRESQNTKPVQHIIFDD